MAIPNSIKSRIKNTSLYRFYINRLHERNMHAEIQLNKSIRGPLIDKYFPKNGIGAELGVLKGNFSRLLLTVTNAKELHLVDPWYFLDSHWAWAGDNTSTVDAVCKILKENKKDIEAKRVFVHIQDDIQVLNTFKDNFFDWVYIDSSHAYEHTVNELEILRYKVKENGIIGGDDWRPNPSHRHHGVYKAVMEFVDKYDYDIIYSNEINLQWFITQRLVNNE